LFLLHNLLQFDVLLDFNFCLGLPGLLLHYWPLLDLWTDELCLGHYYGWWLLGDEMQWMKAGLRKKEEIWK
jgi:hypothetical protein